MAGSCEHGAESAISIKGWEFLDQLSEYSMLKNHTAPFG
jgi:hypothetical protein